MNPTAQSASWRLLAPFVVLALIAGALVTARAATAVPQARQDDGVQMAARDYYFNLAAPLVPMDEVRSDQVVSGTASNGSGHGPLNDLQAWWGQQVQKHSGGFPRAAAQLASTEQQAARSGINPHTIKQAKGTQTAKLLTVLVEFNPEANDDFSGFERIIDINSTAGEDCVTEAAGTLLNGPLHGQLPDPADFANDGTPDTFDNNTFWVPEFDTAHYEAMLYSKEGITERVRTDLIGPDGQPGFDISGYTLRNMYLEMSKGAYDITGEAVGWVMLPHSEAYYGADSCEAGRASMVGHPDNPRDVSQMIVDAVDAIAAADPDFPWADYDIEDQGDLDGDGNVNEPDGVIDHFVIVHAGSGEEGGGGEQGVYAVWSHSSVVDPASGGYTIPNSGGVKVFNYIAQPEDAGVGVFAHEYGHDLGLPDLYDTSGAGDSDVEFWDLMSTGSHSGPIFQSIPAHMGLWDKFVLGWADPKILNPGDDPQAVQVGQTSRTPKGTNDGIRVNLPNKVINLASPHSGDNMWWSNADQNWADVKISRTVDVPAGADVRFWMYNNYVIEFDSGGVWDAGFVEVSTDGGSTWSQLVVKDEAGTVVTTNQDGHGRLQDYGGLQNALSGDTGGDWRHDYVDLTPYAGSTIQLRLRYATDAGFLADGWFADDFSITADGSTTWSDDVESGAGDWTSTLGTFAGTSGSGWEINDGVFSYAQYYLAEWRNFDGFDLGLKYTYDSDYLRFDTGEWSVQRVPYNAPGMLVWYRDIQYGNQNWVTANQFAGPSIGSKGGLLLVDSHFDPLRRQGAAADADPSTLNNIPSRPQASNAAFTTHPTYEFTECLEEPEFSYDLYCTTFAPQAGVPAFTDAKGWYPGFEFRPPGSIFFRDNDASVVIPSSDNAWYSTRITDADGNIFAPFVGLDLWADLFGIPGQPPAILGTGNPADGHVYGDGDLSMGVQFSIKNVKKGNTAATIWVDPGN
ncbi:MAG TPA: immune inhibitor A domain-containing protein [Candidatus Limnocylindria bacterium]